MPIQWWICEVCRKQYDEKPLAEECEINHNELKSTANIVHFLTSNGQVYPTFITVQYKNDSCINVIYELKQIVNRTTTKTTETKCIYCMKSTFEHAHYCPYNPYADR